MKELTIEQKAKAYDKAIEAATKRWEAGLMERYELEELFLELKESEDEKVRKELIDYHKHKLTVAGYSYAHEKWIAWLEKLGEQKSKVIIPKFRIGDAIKANPRLGLEDVTFVIDRIEDDAYWSGENSILICNQDDFELLISPIFRINDIIKNKKTGGEVKITKVDLQTQSYNYIGWNSAATIHSDFGLSDQYKWELVERKPVEWSEEDEKMVDKICYAILVSTYHKKGLTLSEMNSCQGWLKSVKEKLSNIERIGKNWKPSEEQLEALNSLNVTGMITDVDYARQLRLLYEQLKAL